MKMEQVLFEICFRSGKVSVGTCANMIQYNNNNKLEIHILTGLGLGIPRVLQLTTFSSETGKYLVYGQRTRG